MINTQPERFKQNVSKALEDPMLKVAIRRTTDNAETKRALAVNAFPDFAALRDQGARIKDHSIQHLAHYLTEFEKNAQANGAMVHWARDAQEASQIVLDICQQKKAKSVTRSKSMLGEEIGLPDVLDNSGIQRIETDLAEHIIQLACETPSHIIWPALHKTREDVIELFKKHHEKKAQSDEIEDLVKSARVELRQKFLNADVGITGTNFLLADSGATCTVTNEGNAELTATPPKTQIVTAGIEKIVPSMAHAVPLLRLLVRSATGADITQYTTFHNGPKRQNDADGPDEYHIVLVDNGRTKMLLEEDMAEMLRCIRCGACMNHCVVYKHIGGHAYGGTYPGPMGSVLTPVLDGLDRSKNLAHSCTLNGKCQEVCPVNIPLPTMLRTWRAKSWQRGHEAIASRFGINSFIRLATLPSVYHFSTAIAVKCMRMLSKDGWIRRMPLADAWTKNRDMPAPAPTTFMQQYKKRRINEVKKS